MKVGEVGLVPRAGAEFMALETTAEAGTCLACRSMLGLVGSSAQAKRVGLKAAESRILVHDPLTLLAWIPSFWAQIVPQGFQDPLSGRQSLE